MRKVACSTRGQTRGPITRLMSPADLGQRLKPFVFLDLATPDPAPEGFFRWHPHSGIATVTVIVKGAVRYQETTGTTGTLGPGAVEWMASGAGVWHTGAPIGNERLLGFQLWIALDPDREMRPPASQYLTAEAVPSAGHARVILGKYRTATNPIDAPPGLTYLDVRLEPGETWTFVPAAAQTVAWLAVHEGSIEGACSASYGDMVVFEDGIGEITITARTSAGFVLGAAPKLPHDLHIGNHSVHTSAKALQRGESEIARIGAELRASGLLA